ncbi:hypothetical protein BT96DRAFT_934321 [Gymnopus androsaceus JB14]|uniref:Uncharacterized protein n=1 Tax=Gymnopus androsaceus JB14 TaxID=1447944 RepID=A0A6A4IC62_9AGAR|nr:hypothetical protein BT96DRAFT_934321 [Gymnopus androsaceus JB14]
MTGNHLLNIPTFPKASQLSGQDTWQAFKDCVELNVQVKGLMGYLDGSIPKPMSATYLYAAQTTSSIDSQFPSPGEWVQQDCIVASIIYLNCTDPIGIGIKRDTVANKTWKYLVKKYESKDKQHIHIADTTLHEHKFNPETSMMEDHEKKMKNLLKTLHNLGGTCNNYQFRMIVVASMPDTWKDYVLNVPGMLSSEAFTYLHRLYLDKVVCNRDVDDNPVKKQVAALFAQHLVAHAAMIIASAKCDNSNRPICTNPPCPTKVGHTIERCWAKGGGAGGKAPKSWRDKYSSTQASPNTTASPIDVYVGSMSSPKQPDLGTSKHIHSSPTPPDISPRVVNAVLNNEDGQQVRGVDRDVPHLVPKSECTVCPNKTLLYWPLMVPLRTFIDSGATDHCWVNRDQFVDYREVTESAVAGAEVPQWSTLPITMGLIYWL